MTRTYMGTMIGAGVLLMPVNPAFSGNAFVTDYATPKPRKFDAKTRAFVEDTSAKPGWMRFYFVQADQGAGDAQVSPFGDAVEYKLNAVNYNLYLGDSLPIPFQLYYGDFASDESAAETNKALLLDPTQGIAMQFPVAFKYLGDGTGGFCQFSNGGRPGACVLGGDLTLRGVRLNEGSETGQVEESFAFGASASLKASVIFPIFQPPGTSQAGKLGISVAARYYYHNTDNQNLLFGDVSDPDGNSLNLKNGFAAWNAECEFDIFKYFKIRLEYFSPFDDRDVLDDIFKASIVMAPE